MDDEFEALRWVTDEELAAARRRAIKMWNLLDGASLTYPLDQAGLQRTIQRIRDVQEARRPRT